MFNKKKRITAIPLQPKGWSSLAEIIMDNIMTLEGKYCKDCKIFTNNVEEEAIQMIYNIVNHPTFENSKIRIMPDVHAGMGITIGFTAPLTDYVSPSHVGCDIGCMMSSMIFENKLDEKDYIEVEHKINKAVPSGFDIHKKRIFDMKDFIKFMNKHMHKAHSCWSEMTEYVDVDEKYIDKMLKRIGMEASVFYKSLGTVGSGNHFQEYGEFENGSAWTVHCGSRNFGVKVFKYWDKMSNKPYDSALLKTKINDLKKNVSNKRELPKLIEALTNEFKKKNPNGYLSGDNMKGYITDMFFAQGYAEYNHKLICDIVYDILRKYGLKLKETIKTTHNYISPIDHMIRKGAVASYEGEKLIIPFNMRDGLAICVGKSNDEWNCSAPHGAGRIMSRGKAKHNVSLEEYKQSMEGVYSTSICHGTLDESPMVYKNFKEILDLITPTVDVLYLIKPKINIKASEGNDD